MACYGCDLEEEDHDAMSRCLSAMAAQAQGIRATLRKAGGRSSPAAQAAQALVETLGHLAECLVRELDATYGQQAAPVIRTRYLQGR